MSLAEEVRGSGIAVNSLDPGGVITEGALATRPKDYDWSGRVPVSAIGPSAIALALKGARTMTGQVVRREDYGQGPGGDPAPLPTWRPPPGGGRLLRVPTSG
jgi:NAD(P)-dependent dehydrogenase (short-subunit alcohol dehydrogenase family)